MKRNELLSNILFTLFAIFGLAIALLLVSEFFGLSSSAVRAICTSAKSGINTCRTVAESPYALIATLPAIGQIPTAALGVMFYAFSALLGMLNFYSKENARARLFLGLLLSIAGIIADAALYFISVYKIKAVCALCSLSYIATIGMFISAGIALWGNAIRNIIEDVKKYLSAPSRREMISMGIIALLALSAGFCSTAITQYQFKAYARTTESKGEILEAYRSAPIHSIDTTEAPFSGKANAPIHFVLFIDFTCDHCLHAGKEIAKLLKEFPDKIKVSYKLYPLCGECPPRQGSTLEPCCIAALAASCAHREGKFKAAYDALYADLEAGIEHSEKSVEALQKHAGLSNDFNVCIATLQTAPVIVRDTEEGERLHLTGTPALFVNGRRISNKFNKQNYLRELILHLAQ